MPSSKVILEEYLVAYDLPESCPDTGTRAFFLRIDEKL